MHLGFLWLLLGASQVALVMKNPATAGDVRDSGSILGQGRSPLGEGVATPPVFLPGESHETERRA